MTLLDVGQVVCLIGFAEHDIPILIKAKLLYPLGNPKPNSPKYFSAAEIDQLVQDRKWLDKATQVIAAHWREKRTTSELECAGK